MKVNVEGIDWKRVAISEVADVTLGKTPKKSDYRSSGDHKLFKYRDIQANALVVDQSSDGYVTEEPSVLRTLRSVEIGDVLVGASGHSSESIGRKVALVTELPDGGPHFFAGELLRIRPLTDSLDRRWAFHFFSSDEGFRILQGAVSGVHLTNGRARTMEIPLPPMETQVKICDYLDSVAGSSVSAKIHLASAQLAASRFRIAALSAACSGRLSADWRKDAQRPISSDLALHDASNGENLESRSDFPESWRVTRVQDVAEVQLGGTPSRKVESYWTGGVPWVSSGEVANCRIADTKEEISREGLNNSSAKIYPPGTVLIAMIGEGKTRGQSAILDIAASTNQNSAGLIPDEHFVSSEYLWRWALAQYEVTRAAGRGGNQPALNKQKVGELVIAVPPLEEQAEIVRRVDRLLAKADAVVERMTSAEQLLEQSRNSILAHAFLGDALSEAGPIGSR